MTEKQVGTSILRRYKKYSEEEQRVYYERFKKSGVKARDFCREHGMSQSALYEWRKKLTTESNDHDADFSPLKLKNHAPNLPKTQTDIVQLTVAFSNSPMQLSVGIPAHRLASLIQELGYATTIVR